jgi:hypothetical protein
MKRAALPNSPDELLSFLGSIFPAFVPFAEQEPVSGFDPEPLTYHYLMLEFAAFFGREASSSAPRQLRELAEFLSRAVDAGGPLENAVSTCFLEHTRQLKVNRTLGPWLAKARSTRGA